MSRVVRAACVMMLISLATVIAAAAETDEPARDSRAQLESGAPIRIDAEVAVGGAFARVYSEYTRAGQSAEGEFSGLVATYYTWDVARVDGADAGAVIGAPARVEVREWDRASVHVQLDRETGVVRGESEEGGLAVAGRGVGVGDLKFLDREMRPAHQIEPGPAPIGYARLATVTPRGWLFLGDMEDAASRVVGFPALVDATLELGGPGVLQLEGGNATIAGPDGRVERFRLGKWTVGDSRGVTGRAAALELRFGDAEMALPLGTSWSVGLPEPVAEVAGALVIPRASGALSDAEGKRGVDAEDVAMTGTFRVTPARVTDASAGLGAPRTRYEVGGDVAFAVGRGGAAGPDVALLATGAAAASGSALALLFDGPRGIALRALGAFYHRLAPSQVLTNETRARIMRVVREHPGLHLRALGREARLTWGRLVFHLGILEREGHVRVARQGRYRLVYASEALARPDARDAPLHPIARAVLDLVRENGQVLAKDVRADLGVSRQRLAYHLKVLAARGLIALSHEGGNVVLLARSEPRGASPALGRVVEPTAPTFLSGLRADRVALAGPGARVIERAPGLDERPVPRQERSQT